MQNLCKHKTYDFSIYIAGRGDADYDFVQSDDDEPITAIQRDTGRIIVWNGSRWVGYDPDCSK